MRIIGEVHLTKEGKWRGTEHVFTFYLTRLHFFWSFLWMNFYAHPSYKQKTCNAGKDQILQSTDFFKNFFFFSCRLLGFLYQQLCQKLILLPVLSGERLFMVWMEAPLTAQLTVRPITPFLFSAAQPSSNPWVGFGCNYPLFGSFSAHLVSTACSKKCHGCPEKEGEHGQGRWERRRSKLS